MNMQKSPVYVHVDLDAFFASVEQRENPSYRNKPLIVGKIGKRSVVSTCSYEARKYGIHSAMPTLTAYKLCPHGIFVEGNYKLYGQVSRQVMNILKEYTPSLHQVSIDEAWMDMTGSELLFGKPKELAYTIKERIKKEIGITLSIGIASTPFIAKMASDYNKPDGLCMVSPGKEEFFIETIGLEKIWGIGKSTLSALNAANLFTVKQVKTISSERLMQMFGPSMGEFIYKACRGIDPGIRETQQPKSHSISTEITFETDVGESQILNQVLLRMCRELIERSFDEKLIAFTAGLKLRWGDFRTITVQQTNEEGFINSSQLFECAKQLLNSKWKEGQGLRLIGLGLYNTSAENTPIQGSLFDEADNKRRSVDKTVYALKSKGIKLKKASEL